ncbi:MAG: winged helix-turn-helix domain-containing protein [Paludibacteraceae bacterium]
MPTKEEKQEMKQEMKQILQMMIANPEITRSELVEKMHKSHSTVFRMIEKLKSENYIKRIGPTKGGHWKILKPM